MQSASYTDEDPKLETSPEIEQGEHAAPDPDFPIEGGGGPMDGGGQVHTGPPPPES